jgi:hypothetical protein
MSSTTSQVSGAETQSPCHTACWEALVEPLLSLRNLINLERFQKEHHSTLQNHPFSMVSLEIFRKIPPSPHPPRLPAPRGQRRLTEAIATLHVRRSRQQRLNDVQMSIPHGATIGWLPSVGSPGGLPSGYNIQKASEHGPFSSWISPKNCDYP